ncbi:MAG TPA: hypothetical protein VG245_10990 [Candidatus Dormibacteraeota bacterium]|jgi:hypothetical protein|nr:hypothetical protein [Candidatus Dormibacteraeota bacterium]
MHKEEADRNIRMGLLLFTVLVLMGLIAWGWTALFLQFAPANG